MIDKTLSELEKVGDIEFIYDRRTKAMPILDPTMEGFTAKAYTSEAEELLNRAKLLEGYKFTIERV